MSKDVNALDACIRYERAAQQVRDLTIRISAALGPDTASLWDGTRIKNHLWQAYHETTDADSPYPSERRLVDHEQEEYLIEVDCPHCLEAWRLIQQRKDARKAFGAAKRAIRTIGRHAIARGG